MKTSRARNQPVTDRRQRCGRWTEETRSGKKLGRCSMVSRKAVGEVCRLRREREVGQGVGYGVEEVAETLAWRRRLVLVALVEIEVGPKLLQAQTPSECSLEPGPHLHGGATVDPHGLSHVEVVTRCVTSVDSKHVRSGLEAKEVATVGPGAEDLLKELQALGGRGGRQWLRDITEQAPGEGVVALAVVGKAAVVGEGELLKVRQCLACRENETQDDPHLLDGTLLFQKSDVHTKSFQASSIAGIGVHIAV